MRRRGEELAVAVLARFLLGVLLRVSASAPRMPTFATHHTSREAAMAKRKQEDLDDEMARFEAELAGFLDDGADGGAAAAAEEAEEETHYGAVRE